VGHKTLTLTVSQSALKLLSSKFCWAQVVDRDMGQPTDPRLHVLRPLKWWQWWWTGNGKVSSDWSTPHI